MKTIIADKKIYLGQAGEKNQIKVLFFLDEEMKQIATSQNTYIAFKQQGEQAGVPLNVTIVDGVAEWVLNCSILKSGEGKAQLTVLKDGSSIEEYPFVQIAKTKVYKTFADESLNTVPCACSSWMDEVLALVKAWRDGYLGTLNLEFVNERPLSPRLNVMYAVKTGTSYVLQMYHDGKWEVFAGGGTHTPYTGAYQFTPQKSNEQIGLTNNHYMTDNITVHKIPYLEVDNPFDGKTITIG